MGEVVRLEFLRIVALRYHLLFSFPVPSIFPCPHAVEFTAERGDEHHHIVDELLLLGVLLLVSHLNRNPVGPEEKFNEVELESRESVLVFKNDPVDFPRNDEVTQLNKTLAPVVQPTPHVLDDVLDSVFLLCTVRGESRRLSVDVPMLLLVLRGAPRISGDYHILRVRTLRGESPDEFFDLRLPVTAVPALCPLGNQPPFPVPPLEGGFADTEKVLGVVKCKKPVHDITPRFCR